MITTNRENPERAELQAAVEEYLARGGKITQLGTTDPAAHKSLREVADEYKRRHHGQQ